MDAMVAAEPARSRALPAPLPMLFRVKISPGEQASDCRNITSMVEGSTSNPACPPHCTENLASSFEFGIFVLPVVLLLGSSNIADGCSNGWGNDQSSNDDGLRDVDHIDLMTVRVRL